MAHEPLPGILPPFNLTPTFPADNVPLILLLTTPPQVLVIAVLATVKAPGVVGKVSVNDAALNVTAFELNRVMVSVETPPALIVVGEKDLVIVGWARMAIVALAAKALSPSGVLSAPAGSVLV